MTPDQLGALCFVILVATLAALGSELHVRMKAADLDTPTDRVEEAFTATTPIDRYVLDYERIVDEDKLLASIRLFDGEMLLVLRPFGWHLNGRHLPNMAEHFEREFVLKEHGLEVVCEFGPYVAIVRPKAWTPSASHHPV